MFRTSSCPSSGAKTTAVTASGLLSELGDSSVVGRGRAGRSARPRPTTLLSPSSDGKPEAATAVVAPDDGHKDARNMLSLFKRQVINSRNCYIWLVDSVECMMMHGLTKPKFVLLFCCRIFLVYAHPAL